MVAVRGMGGKVFSFRFSVFRKDGKGASFQS
jgi:hypothetical protein